MALSRPLAVAVAAMALLVMSIGFEVVVNRAFTLEVHNDTGWVPIGQSGSDDQYRVAKPIDTRGGDVVTAARDATLQFRITVDNGYPWAYSEAYDARVAGVIVAEGTLNAPSRGTGDSSFTVRAATFLSMAGSPEPKPGGGNITFAYLDVQVGSDYLTGNFQLQEAS